MFPFSFFGASITYNNSSLCPLNSFKLIFQTNLMQKKFKNYKPFFSLCRSLILNLMYFCNFQSPRFEIASCSNPLRNISKPMSLIKIGFSNEELCQISHDRLIIDWFSSTSLYEVTRVTVLTLGSKTDTTKTRVHPIFVNSYEISI